MTTIASGHGIATMAAGKTLDVWFPTPQLASLPATVPNELSALVGKDDARGVTRELVAVEIDITAAPADAKDAYLRLHLLSHRLVKPHGLSLEGIFGLLNNVVWTNFGPCAVDGFEVTRARLKAAHGHVTVLSVDKFPRMVDYVIPSGVRIADADRVRLGAHLASGTTVMHEGFVNFNAGTLGTSMVEGRISAGVVVGDGSDVGGGASIMGTSLGDNCVIEAGTYVTAASKVRLPDGEIVKAAALSGGNNLLFRRNSLDGALEAINRTGTWGGLNSILHAN